MTLVWSGVGERWFGWATEEDLQPDYGGLSFDETLLRILPAAAVVLITRRALRHSVRSHRIHTMR